MSFEAIYKDKTIVYTLFTNKTAVVGDVTSTGNSVAVEDCNQIYGSTVEIPSKVLYKSNEYTVFSLYKKAFYRCTLENIKLPETIKYLGASCLDICNTENKVVFPDSIESIGSFAFATNKNKTIYIPKNVAFISSGAFSFNLILEEIVVDNQNTFYKTDSQGILYNREMTQLIQAPTTLNSIKIPETVQYVFGGSLAYCKISEVIFPVSVKKIDIKAISLCNSLKKVYIYGNVKISEVQTQGTSLDLFFYHGTLSINSDIFEDNVPNSIVVCHGYNGEKLGTHPYTTEKCPSHPIEHHCNSCLIRLPFKKYLLYIIILSEID